MTWIDRIENTELEIETGDGEIYKPLWIKAVKNVNYNTEGYDFVGVQGTYVSRSEKSGDQFPLSLYFQGEDCIDEAEAFEVSSRDPRPWKIKHPFFNSFEAQPLSLQFDYSEYNVVNITGTVWRTIAAKFPTDVVDPSDAVINRKLSSDAAAVAYLDEAIPSPGIALVSPLGSAITSIGKAFDVITKTAAKAKVLKDLVRTASGAIQNVFDDLTSFTNSLVDLINFPFTIIGNIEDSIEGFKTAFEDLIGIFDTNDEQQQAVAEVGLTTLLSSMSSLLVSPTAEDYQTRAEVAAAAEALTELYADLTSYYDSNSYAQDASIALSLDVIINETLANLYDIAFKSKQERSVILGKDSDPVNLAHTYFGRGDDALDQFIRVNDLTLAEYFEIKKGREIIYFV